MKECAILAIALFLSLNLFSQENNSILCSDGIDNDGDGLIDCFDPNCSNLPSEGCSTCTEGISFADTLIEYIPGCNLPNLNPTGAIGVSDWASGSPDNLEVVSLGEGGSIKLGFTNNLIVNSGNPNADLWVFEAGDVESSRIKLKPANLFTETQLQLLGIPDAAGDGYYSFGSIGGATTSIDIDAITPGYSMGELQFDAIEIIDIPDIPCFGETPGADIDAVCALSPFKVDCLGTPNGDAVLDDCGVCLDLSDPNFNQSCIDCLGQLNGNAVIDACGECLNINDPNFNQSCSDCLGIPNGSAVLDDCGVCLNLNDPNFNQSCIDCSGVLNGTALIDSCGVCLESSDPDFNQSCLDCSGAPNGVAIIDDCGICNDPNSSSYNQSCSDCLGVLFGDATIDSCGICLQSTDANFNKSCIKDIYIPNTFSPNYDGVNDVFEVFKRDGANATITNYKIFSRWGEMLYQASNFQFSDQDKWWNGEFRNRKMVNGTYLYYIEVLFQDGASLKYEGDLYLSR